MQSDSLGAPQKNEGNDAGGTMADPDELTGPWSRRTGSAPHEASGAHPACGARAVPGADDGAMDFGVLPEMSGAARSLFAAGDVGSIVGTLLDLAVGSIDGCDHAGVVVDDGEVTTLAVTSSLAAELDALQQHLGEGPCLDAMATGGFVHSSDLAAGSPWAAWGPAAAAAGVRSTLVLAFNSDRRGALSCYGASPAAFSVIERGKALVLATLAGLAMSSADKEHEADEHTKNLEAALGTRELIGQAQGILMERERISADRAFDILRRASQDLNVKLRDVAQRLVDTGEDPSGCSGPL